MFHRDRGQHGRRDRVRRAGGRKNEQVKIEGKVEAGGRGGRRSGAVRLQAGAGAGRAGVRRQRRTPPPPPPPRELHPSAQLTGALLKRCFRPRMCG